ncbi:MAG: nickel pincer cofactor biosynthesis protein LarB [Blastocatellia bacterium]|nr:nickel pincer cofactor biosynthesis protein LarB [Blastocatellia bacterium]
MNADKLRHLLEEFKADALSLDELMQRLKYFPYEDIEFARIDHHRSVRQGFPEVIFGQGKTSTQIAAIVEKLLRAENNVLVTRTNREAYDLVKETAPDALFNELARTISIKRDSKIKGKGKIGIITAGTSDIPVSEEAAVTAEICGNEIERLYDVGVAGLHRILSETTRLSQMRVVVCVAGMEGALPSVVGGLVSAPVIAVPTSIGYGASFGGIAAMLGMLNSCASNVLVVNIDNGFGAGFTASIINRL